MDGLLRVLMPAEGVLVAVCDNRRGAKSDHLRQDSLAELPHSIENVTFLTKTGPQSGTFTGVLLWNLLNKAGN
jgi:hypothetical protein